MKIFFWIYLQFDLSMIPQNDYGKNNHRSTTENWTSFTKIPSN